MDSWGFLHIGSYHLGIEMVLLLPFSFGCLVFPPLAWLLWLQLPVPCWLAVVKVGIFILFLILESWKGFVFYDWIWCYLWGFTNVLYHFEEGSSHSYFFKCFGYERVLDFVKCFFYDNWNDHIFSFILLLLRNYIGWFLHIEPPLNSLDKFHLVIVYNPFNMLFDSVC